MSYIKNKKIKLHEILLLTLAGTLDFIAEIKDPLNLYSNYYKNFYGYIPSRWKKQNFSRLIRDQINKKTVQKIKRGHEQLLIITKKGSHKILNKYPLYAFQNNVWDGKWRIVIFDILELKRNIRNTLREKLKLLGFGQLQKSVWISPYPVYENFLNFIKEKNIIEEVIIFEALKIDLDNELILRKAWNLIELKASYLKCYQKLSKLKEEVKTKKATNLDEKFKRLHKKILDIIFNDPQLPAQLLPKNWPKNKTIKLLKKLSRHFNK